MSMEGREGWGEENNFLTNVVVMNGQHLISLTTSQDFDLKIEIYTAAYYQNKD